MVGVFRVMWFAIALSLLVADKVMACESSGTLEWRTMPVTQLFLRSKEGVTRRFDVRIAETPKQRAAGFQHICPDLIQKWSILFVFQEPQLSTFHMRNVKGDLEIAFINQEGRFLEVQQMTLEQETVPSGIYRTERAYQYALETAIGKLSLLGLISEDWWLVLDSWGS